MSPTLTRFFPRGKRFPVSSLMILFARIEVTYTYLLLAVFSVSNSLSSNSESDRIVPFCRLWFRRSIRTTRGDLSLASQTQKLCACTNRGRCLPVRIFPFSDGTVTSLCSSRLPGTNRQKLL